MKLRYYIRNVAQVTANNKVGDRVRVGSKIKVWDCIKAKIKIRVKIKEVLGLGLRVKSFLS